MSEWVPLFAVEQFQRGGVVEALRIQVVSHQLGHRDTSMVSRVYGRYLPKAEDYEVSDSTISATTLKKSHEVRRAKGS